ncbi:MAG: THUMP domain-containing protein, partial [Candidatus Uhrbacteria bacterium]
MKYSHILVHYGEIGLKGKNRTFFEQQLVRNIKVALEGCDQVKGVRRLYGRILIELDDQKIKNQENKKIIQELNRVFGITSFSPVMTVKNDFDLIQETALELVRSSESDWQTFKVITKRSHKLFPATSMEVSRD